jgi:hypothetical protein
LSTKYENISKELNMKVLLNLPLDLIGLSSINLYTTKLFFNFIRHMKENNKSKMRRIFYDRQGHRFSR